MDGAMLICTVTMQPQIRLLHGVEDRASAEWMSRVFCGATGLGVATPCRIVDAATSRLTTEYFRTNHALMHDDVAWDVCAGHQRTQRESMFELRHLLSMQQRMSNK